MNYPRVRIGLTTLGIAAVTLWVHWFVLGNKLLAWDDRYYVDRAFQQGKISVQSIRWAFSAKETVFGYYHPLTWLSHLLDCQLWGMQPAGHHLTSLLLHALNTALVVAFVWVLLKTIPTLATAERWAMSAVSGLVFGIHPLQVESVAWVAERKNLLCATFALASLSAYVLAVRSPKGRGWWWGSVGLYGAALLSKPTAVSLPFVMLVLDFYPLRRHLRVGWKRLLTEKVLLLAVAIAWSVLTIATQAGSGALPGFVWNSAPQRVLSAARATMFYLWKLLWPAWLSPHYPMVSNISVADMQSVLSVCACAGITAIGLFAKDRLPGLLSAWVAYLAMILPVSGLVAFASHAAADRNMYLAMLPALIVTAWGCIWLWRHMGLAGRAALLVLFSCYLAFLGFRARGETAVWRNDETLWRAALSHFPDSWVANYQLGVELADQQRFEEALPFAVKSVQLTPGFARSYALLGLVQLKRDQYEEADKQLAQALQIEPTLRIAALYRACLYTKQAKFEEAYDTLRQVLAAAPEFAETAENEPELAGLRSHPVYADQFRELIDRTANRHPRP